MSQVIQIGSLEFRIRPEFRIRKKLPNVDRMSEIVADESLVKYNNLSYRHLSQFYPPLFFLFLAMRCRD